MAHNERIEVRHVTPILNVSNIEEGIGVLPTLLLRKQSYRSMAGGDGACCAATARRLDAAGVSYSRSAASAASTACRCASALCPAAS